MRNREEIWDKLVIAADQHAAERDYWLKELSGDLVKTTFPNDFKESAPGEFREGPDSLSFSITGELFSRLINLSNGVDHILHMILVAGWVVLLDKYNYNGSKDIIVGAPIYRQDDDDGELINSILPLRFRLLEHLTFKNLLLQVKETIIRAVEHYSYPMEILVEQLGLASALLSPPDMGFPLFDVAVLVENIHNKSYLEHIRIGITISFLRTGDGIHGKLEYNTALYRKSSVELIIRHFTRLMAEALSNMHLETRRLGILTEEEKNQVLYRFNNTARDYPGIGDSTVHRLFEQEVERTPDKTAVVFKDQQITYRVLNQKANQLAYFLRARGVKPNTIAAIMVEPCLEMVIGILGILKAGGAYLPIDLEYPESRILQILSDGSASLLLTKGNALNTFAITSFKQLSARDNEINHEIVFLDNIAEALAMYPMDNPVHVNQTGDLLYLISTSGSTGKPKSVMLEHRNLVNLLNFQFLESGIDYNTNILQFSSIGFDVSAQEIFSALLAGGKLWLMDRDLKGDASGLLDFIKKNKIGIVFWPPAYLKLIFSEPVYAEKFPASVRHIIAAGEQLIVPPLLKKHLKENRVYLTNNYGPSETHVVTTLTMEPAREIPVKPSIGKPISNTAIYLLDEEKNLQPIGVIGELYIAGANVGRGYYNRDDLTTERYMPDPFIPGGRMYRTGDLARWLPDGNIEFIGRNDSQVKVRGFRVELAEIENRLREIEYIKEALVIDRTGKGEQNYLYGYIVSEREIDPTEVRLLLSGNLPDFMIPSYFMHVDKIPLTLNGKVDRRALPDPEAAHAGKTKTRTAPANEIEEKLIDLWANVLEIDKNNIGVTDNFFALGGHSLKATILVTRIHKVLDVKITLGEMFKWPTIRQLAEFIKETVHERYSAIQPAEEKEYYDVSSAQKRMYLIHRLEEKTVGYNIAVMMVLEGCMERDSLEKVFRELVRRHESLRTSFELIEDKPRQKVHDDVEFKIEYHLATEDTESTEKGVEIQNSKFKIQNSFIRPFNLSKAPLLRVGLIKKTEQSHILMLDMHHIISDGISMGNIAREFMALYAGEKLKPLRLQYKDYSEWQQGMSGKEREALLNQEKYWLTKFAAEIPALELPTDYARPDTQGFEGRSIESRVGKGETLALKKMALDCGVTLFTLLFTIYDVFLWKLTGQEDIVVGTPVAGRRHADLQPIVGMFVNTIALRSSPRGDLFFEEFLQEVKEDTIAAFENQDFPFEELVEKLAVTRDMSRSPVFDVMFTLQNLDIPALKIPGLSLLPYNYENKTSKFDLTLHAVESEGSLVFTFEYSTKLFHEDTIKRFTRYFERIAAGIPEDSKKKMSEIEIIPEEEKKQVLFDFNDTYKEYPAYRTIHELFAEQAERSPGGTALVGNEHDTLAVGKKEKMHLTYGVLNENADQLAHLLKEKGVKADTIVGIMMERSVEMIIGIMGILKAGGAYLPIEPEYPQERIDYMLKDSGARLLVTTNNKEGEKVRRWEGEIYYIEEFIYASFPLTFLPSYLHSPSNLAYVIYTSGSTGTPKGVMVEHLSVVNILSALQEAYPLESSDTYLMKTSYIFDVSVVELFGWFWAGGRMAVLEAGDEKDPQKIIETLERRCVTHINFVPSMFNAFVAQLHHQNITKFPSLKYIFLAGEALLPELVKNFGRLNTGVALENIYGPTEGTIYASSYSLSQWSGRGMIPIGKPLPNIRIYIQDKTGSIQPIGVAGELCISGRGVARGYLNNPELTAEKFRRDVISHLSLVISSSKSTNDQCPMTNDRLYRTGDLARWLSDGNIEFLGRIDHQIKIRGFRIELGEIENRLMTHKNVKKAVLLLREDETGDKYLCAYVECVDSLVNENTHSRAKELREYLSQSLPKYMIPAYIMLLPDIPLTQNGKIDRKALPEPEHFSLSESGYEMPTNVIERKIAAIWQEVLKIEKVGINDNFIELGGHSLLVISIIASISKAFDVDLQLNDVFKNPTVKQLARLVMKSKKTVFSSIQPVEEKEYYPMSYQQKGLYFIQKFEPESISYNMPMVFVLKKDVQRKKLEEALRRLIKRHKILRTSFEIINDNPAQRVHHDAMLKVDYYEMDEDEAKMRAMDYIKPFDLSITPLMRIKLIKISDEKHIIILDLHHIITDAASHMIFIRELMELYSGEKKELTPVRIHYSDYSQWHSQLSQSQELKRQEDYWLSRFSGELPLLKMATDFPRQAEKNLKGDRVQLKLDMELSNKVKKYINETGSTHYILMLTIYIILLSKYSGQDDIVVGSPVSGRTHPDLYNIIGLFANMLPMRNSPKENIRFRDFFEQVKTNTLNAFENQDYQFTELVSKLDISKDLSRHPLFDVVLALENAALGDIAADDLRIEPYSLNFSALKFDLLLDVLEGEGFIIFNLNYSVSLFKRATAEKMLQHLAEILRQIIEDDTVMLKDIKISHDLMRVESVFSENKSNAFEF